MKTLFEVFHAITLLITSTLVFSEGISVGKTYPIAEPDTLKEIKNKSLKVNWRNFFKTDINDSTAIESPILPYAKQNVSRKHTPIYRLPESILDQYGEIIYPKGYEFNPLEYVPLPNRILVMGHKRSDLEWVQQQGKEHDMVLTSGGNPLELSQSLKKPVFIIDSLFIKRFDLKVVPTLITQEGADLILHEFVVGEGTNETNSTVLNDPA